MFFLDYTMSRHTTDSMTPGRIRKVSAGISNIDCAFDDDIDEFELDENDFDGSKIYQRNIFIDWIALILSQIFQ